MSAEQAQDQDAVTLHLLAQIKQQREEIQALDRPNYRTNMLFSTCEGKPSSGVNLNTLRGVDELVKVAAFIIDLEETYAQAALRLGVQAPAFTWDGSKADDWLHDIRLRIDKLQVNQKKARLERLEARAEAIISPELRRRLEIEAIQADLLGEGNAR